MYPDTSIHHAVTGKACKANLFGIRGVTTQQDKGSRTQN
jgi:hypothetical protein